MKLKISFSLAALLICVLLQIYYIKDVEGFGAYHKRRTVGRLCSCQLKFEDCVEKRGLTDAACNSKIAKHYMCDIKFMRKGGKTYAKAVNKDLTAPCDKN